MMQPAPSPTDGRPTGLLSWPGRAWSRLDGIQRGLVLLLLARWLLDTLFMLNVIPLEIRLGWHLHHGGDQEFMYDLARSLVKHTPEEAVVGLGQALVMAPWVALLDPEAYMDIVAPLVVINGYILGGLSVLLVGGIARAVVGAQDEERAGRVALAAAGLWALLPLIVYLSFFWHPRAAIMRSAAAPKLAWLNGLSDGPAVFFLLLATFLLARALHDPTRRDPQRPAPGFWRMLGVGAALGAAITFRFHIVPMAAALLLYVALAYGRRPLLAALEGALLAYLPQAWYNLTVFNFPFTTGYISYGDGMNYGGTFRRSLADFLTNVPFYPQDIWAALTALWSHAAWAFGLGALALVAVVAGLVWLLRRIDWRPLALLVVAPLTYLLPMLAAFNFHEDPIRFTMPALPSLMIAALAGAASLPRWLRADARGRPATAQPVRPGDAGYTRRRFARIAAALLAAYVTIYVLANPLITTPKVERDALFSEAEERACVLRERDQEKEMEPGQERDQAAAREAIADTAESNRISTRRLITIVIATCRRGTGISTCGEAGAPMICSFSENDFSPR